MAKQRVLLLSAGAGTGHGRAAQALKFTNSPRGTIRGAVSYVKSPGWFAPGARSA